MLLQVWKRNRRVKRQNNFDILLLYVFYLVKLMQTYAYAQIRIVLLWTLSVAIVVSRCANKHI